MSETNARRTLGVIFYEDFELLDVYGPLEMFGSVGAELADRHRRRAHRSVASFQGPQTGGGVDFASAPKLDLILLPGGFGTMRELENPVMLNFLRRRSASAEVTMSVCTGSAILARAGLLDGRRATSNKAVLRVGAGQGPAVEWVEEARWVEDGPFATSSGVSAGTDMALAWSARLYGKETGARSPTPRSTNAHDSTRDPFSRFLNKGNARRSCGGWGARKGSASRPRARRSARLGLDPGVRRHLEMPSLLRGAHSFDAGWRQR